MPILKEQYREFEKNLNVFETGAQRIEAEMHSEQKERPELVPELTYDPEKTDPDSVWADIDAKYGEDAYNTLISAYVDKLIPNTQSPFRSSITRESKERYMRFYGHIRREFMKQENSLREDFEWARDHISDKAREELYILRSQIEGAEPLSQFREKMPSAKERGAVERYFRKYLSALNGRYFNKHANAGVKIPGVGIPILEPFIFADGKSLQHRAHPEERESVPILGPVIGSEVFKGMAYEGPARDFQYKMDKWVDAKLDWIMDHQPTTAKLTAFRKEIAARYDLYSRIDADSSIISTADMKVLEDAASPPFKTLERMMDESDDQIVRRLEVMQLMDYDSWENNVDLLGDAVIKVAVDSGAEKEFIAQVNKEAETYGLSPVQNFGQAKRTFKAILSDLSPVGVRETLDFLRDFNAGAHQDVLSFENEVDPASLRPYVRRQIEHLMNGRLVPQKEEDRAIVRFIAADLKGRRNMLSNAQTRAVLFRGIRLATKLYPDIYSSQFKVPTDPEKMRFSPRIRKPRGQDQAAQMQALIVLGKQAEYTVNKLNEREEFRGQKFSAEIESFELPDAKRFKTGLRFKPPTPRHKRYVSDITRGGFNMRDLSLKGAKVFGTFVVLANVSQSWSQAGDSSEDILDRIFQTAEIAATNPALLAGAGVTVLAQKAERDKRLLKWPWLSQHEREDVMTGYKLDNIFAKVGPNNLKNFLGNSAEWRAMNHPKMSPDTIKELVQKAGKRAKKGSRPVITLEDMKEVIPEASITASLTAGGRSDRTRYLFYSKFMTGRIKPDVHHIKELCTGNSYIDSGIEYATEKTSS